MTVKVYRLVEDLDSYTARSIDQRKRKITKKTPFSNGIRKCDIVNGNLANGALLVAVSQHHSWNQRHCCSALFITDQHQRAQCIV